MTHVGGGTTDVLWVHRDPEVRARCLDDAKKSLGALYQDRIVPKNDGFTLARARAFVFLSLIKKNKKTD